MSFRKHIGFTSGALIAAMALLVTYAPSASAVGEPRGEPATPTAEQNLWVDADPGCGGPFHADVDDCWALLHAVRMGRGRIAGISTVFGNVSGERAWVHSQQWLGLLGTHYREPIPPLHRGLDEPVHALPSASVHSESGKPASNVATTSAHAAIARFLDASSPRSATVLMLGPVSNLAAVLNEKPQRAQRIRRVILLGGQPPGMRHWLPVAGRLRMRDYNVIKDPLAMQWLLQAKVPIDFVPVQAAFGHWLNAQTLQTLGKQTAATRWLVEAGTSWERFWRWGFGAPGYPPFDLLASGLLFEPERFSCEVVDARMALFPSVWGEQTGLALTPLSSPLSSLAQASKPHAPQSASTPSGQVLYRRCGLNKGSALDLIRSALESTPHESR